MVNFIEFILRNAGYSYEQWHAVLRTASNDTQRYALRVAIAGEIAAARHAGPYTAIKPSVHNKPAP